MALKRKQSKNDGAAAGRRRSFGQSSLSIASGEATSSSRRGGLPPTAGTLLNRGRLTSRGEHQPVWKNRSREEQECRTARCTAGIQRLPPPMGRLRGAMKPQCSSINVATDEGQKYGV